MSLQVLENSVDCDAYVYIFVIHPITFQMYLGSDSSLANTLLPEFMIFKEDDSEFYNMGSSAVMQ